MQFLLKNKGSLYNGKGFEMLAALNQHCCPDSVANAFTTLFSLFNDGMGEIEEIMAFRACILEKFRPHYKSLDDATPDSIIMDVCFHSKFS